MVMEIADRLKINFMQLINKTKQILVFLFLLCFAFILNAYSQTSRIEIQIEKSQTEFDNGDYAQALETSQSAVEKAKKENSNQLISEGLKITAASQISLQRYGEAEISLNEALRIVSENKNCSVQKSEIYIYFAWLWRTQREFAKALDYSRKAVAEAPMSKHILGEHYLNLGRILFSSGYDISAIIWLEKAEKVFESEKTSSAKLDNYRFLHLAWAYRLNYQKALAYAENLVKEAEKSRFKRIYRQALFDLSSIQSATGQKNAAHRTIEKGRQISQNENKRYQEGLFLSSLLLSSLYEYEVENASKHLLGLEKINSENAYSFEILLGKAVISAFKNQPQISEKLFSQLDKMENTSEYILPSWKIIIAKRNKEWEKVIKINQELLELTEKDNFRDGLPEIYLDFALAYLHLGQNQKSLENLEKSLSLIEELRQTQNNNLSLGLMETHHNAYRLLVQIKSDNPQESFELADFLKARFLKDKINNSVFKTGTNFSPEIRQKLEELSLRFSDDQDIVSEIEKTEKLVTSQIPDLNLTKPDLTELNSIPELDNAAIISYFFTSDRKLQAFVWEKEKSLKIINVPITEDEVDFYAKTTHQKIKNLIFFKKDGKDLYDKILKPLNISSKHLVIVPDKSLWKIPFQALSSDGQKYLIEDKLISYTPSVSILFEQLKTPKQNRQTLQAFANPSYENRFLQYVNAEAASVAEIYTTKPKLNATVGDFERVADKSDIFHFSMHAQVNNEQPLESFLAFKKNGNDDGLLTVEEILNVKLKKGSLVFLASCDTNNVLNGEGFVSLAWGMLASGATTVISAGWEANDKSTEVFSKTFYQNYKQGNSSAEAVQKASLELIKNKANNAHEPYYWADFTLSGDFR